MLGRDGGKGEECEGPAGEEGPKRVVLFVVVDGVVGGAGEVVC